MRANPYVLVIAFCSLVAASITASLFFLLPSPQDILRIAQANASRLKTAVVDIDGRYEVERGGRRTSYHASAKGAVDRRDPAQVAFSQDASLEIDGEVTAQFKGEIRRVDGQTYLRISGTDQWSKFADDELRRDAGLPAGERLAEEARTMLEAEFRVIPLLRYERTLPPERIGGVNTLHFEVAPDLLAAKQLAVSYMELRVGRALTSSERADLDASFANVAAERGEAWIGTDDKRFRRLRIRLRLDDGKKKGTLDVVAVFSAFNAPVVIAAPQGTIVPFASGKGLPLPGAASGFRIVQPSSAGSSLPSQPAANDADADKDGLDDASERFFGTDRLNPDTDGNGVSDGEEVRMGRNPNGGGGLYDFGLPFGR